MNRGIEEQFVESYIVKNRQERMLFELRGKRREDAVWRFCHRSDEMLIESRIKACGPKIEQVLRQRIAQSRAEKISQIKKGFPQAESAGKSGEEGQNAHQKSNRSSV